MPRTTLGTTSLDPYLGRWGITRRTANCFSVSALDDKHIPSGVVLPIRDRNSKAVASVVFSVRDFIPRYMFTPDNFQTSSQVFHIERAVIEGEHVIVVQEILDAMKVHEAGYPCVVSVMGTELSPEQEIELVREFRSVILMFSGDSQGRCAAHRAANRIMKKLLVRVPNTPARPAAVRDMSTKDITRLISEL